MTIKPDAYYHPLSNRYWWSKEVKQNPSQDLRQKIKFLLKIVKRGYEQGMCQKRKGRKRGKGAFVMKIAFTGKHRKGSQKIYPTRQNNSGDIFDEKRFA
jgi:hypothetical protein